MMKKMQEAPQKGDASFTAKGDVKMWF